MNNVSPSPTLLITGGAGFVGQAVLRELADASPVLSPARIRILDRRPPDAYPAAISDIVEFVEGDIRDPESVAAACEGVDAVLHLANLVDWGTHPVHEVHAINVAGTEHIIQACRDKGVKALVYTSSLDAIFSGQPIRMADETHPYPSPFTSTYAETKAISEGHVVKANGETLKTAVLRPSGVYGEADPYHLSGLVEIAQKKGPYFRIGNGKSQCMHIYVGNVAHAHLMAAKSLLDGNEKIAGQIYFLVDSPPKNFFHHLDPVLEQAGFSIKPENLWIPGWIIYPIAVLNELFAFLIRPIKRINPKVSRFAIKYICTDFTLNGEKATRDFGFTPKYDTKTAVARSAAWFKENGPVKSR